MSLMNLDTDNSSRQMHAGPSSLRMPQKRDLYNLDLLDLVRRKFGIISFFVFLGIGLALLYYFKAPKTYESKSKIFVDEKNAPSLNIGDGGSFVNEVSVENYLQKLKSSLILGPAIKAGRLADLEIFKDSEDILFELKDGDSLVVKPADTRSDSGVMELSFSSKSPEECKLVLEAIVGSFDAHIRATTKDVGGTNADLVRRAQNEFLDNLKNVEKQIEELMVNPELLNIDGRIINPYQMQLSLMHQDLHNLRSDRNKIVAQVENVKMDLTAGLDSDDLIGDIMSEDSDVSDSAYARTQDQLVLLKIEEQALLNQYGGDHPELRSVRRKISTVEQMRSQEIAAINIGQRNSDGDEEQNIAQLFLKKMDRKLSMLGAEEKQVETQILAVQTKSTSVSSLVERLNALQRERERLEVGYAAVVEKMSEMNALKEHLWRNLAVLDPPSLAEAVAPKLSTSLLAGLFLGGLLGMCFAGFKDMAEKTFRSSDSVGESLGTRVIGHVSLFEKTRSKSRHSNFHQVQPEVITLHSSSSQASEAYRAIRTAIFFKARETGARIIQVTSPMPGDGKSTTTANLATTIAQSGSRVLLIDADMRKPTQHKLFGLDTKVGLSSVIGGEVDPSEAAQVILPGHLSVITAGPIPANPAELLTSARFAKILEEYRDTYDYVLIDTPPMLAVTDPSIVCGQADLVYMVMRIRNGVRTNSIRAKEIIDSMGIELGGVIINGLRRRDQKDYAYSGQYGYGTNTYGQASRAKSKTLTRQIPR